MLHLYLMGDRFRFKLRHNIYSQTQPETLNGVSIDQALQSTVREKVNPTIPGTYIDPTRGYEDKPHNPSGFSVDPDADNLLNMPPIIHIIDPITGRIPPQDCISCGTQHTLVVQDSDGLFKNQSLSEAFVGNPQFETSDQLERYQYNQVSGTVVQVANSATNGPQFYTEKEMVLYQKGELTNFETHRKLFFYGSITRPNTTFFKAMHAYNRGIAWNYKHIKFTDRIQGEQAYWQLIGGFPFVIPTYTRYAYKTTAHVQIY